LTAFQGQLLFTLPTAIFSRSFVLSSVFIFQNASPEALAEVKEKFEAFFEFK
jgi:hypothetical protein